MGDPVLSALLLRNLLDNAAHSSPSQGSIVITLERRSLSMANSGGVDDACLPRLGERFYRPPGQVQHGSGLGLSIVKRIAELSGWTVKIGNAPGLGGKRFMVTITFDNKNSPLNPA